MATLAIILAIFTVSLEAKQKKIQGPPTTKELTLELEVAKDGEEARPERFNLTYWTTLIEPKRCVKDPFDCDLKEYTTYMEAQLELKNVDVSDLDKVGKFSEIEIRLAFNQIDKALVNVYDIFKFTFPWSKQNLKLREGWKCVDGYAKPEKDQTITTPKIDVIGDTEVDSFLPDRAQDCIVD